MLDLSDFREHVGMSRGGGESGPHLWSPIWRIDTALGIMNTPPIGEGCRDAGTSLEVSVKTDEQLTEDETVLNTGVAGASGRK